MQVATRKAPLWPHILAFRLKTWAQNRALGPKLSPKVCTFFHSEAENAKWPAKSALLSTHFGTLAQNFGNGGPTVGGVPPN
jgi:hypothetical protein